MKGLLLRASRGLLLVTCLALAGAPACDDGGGDFALPPCPADPPSPGEPCERVGQSCFWQRCGGAEPAQTSAWCQADGWAVEPFLCDEVSCRSGACAVDQVCREMAGGALLVDCAANPCGEGPVEPACACALCGDLPCTVTGLTVTCNTCQSGICP